MSIGGDPRRAADAEGEDFSNMRRAPMWLRPWVFILNFFGAPCMFVLILIAQDAGYIPSRSRDTVTALNAHTVQASAEASARIAADQALAKALERLQAALDRNNRVVRVICADRGRDPDVRNACLWGSDIP